MVDPSRRDPVRSRPGRPEPVRPTLRIACALLGTVLVLLALVTAAAEPNPWLSLPPMAIGALLLAPALGARAAASEEEAGEALERALELAQAARALLVPALFGLVVARVLERAEPGFSLERDVVGAIAAALIAALVASGVGCAVAALYYRAKALGR